jgi:xanthine dehydrogenase YagR molybdenum-binding subunit
MATQWPKKKRLIGTKVSRVDGPAKATGRAKYSYDINRPGMLHGVILRCPYARAKVKSIDTSKAEKMPGVKAIHIIATPQKNKDGTESPRELFYAGDEVVALAADTEEHALDAMRELAAGVEYEQLEFMVREDEALSHPDKKTTPGQGNSNVQAAGKEYTKGNVEEAFKTSDAVVTGVYGAAVISHQCLEPHGLVAEWTSDGGLTVWASTQATTGTAQALAGAFGIPPTKVKCITHYMGGGYGSKFGPDSQGIAAAHLAKKAGAPVKLMLDRADEVTTAGNRPSVYGSVRIAGNKNGAITAFEVDCHGTSGYYGGATVNLGLLPYVYLDAVPNIKRKHSAIRVNAGGARAMRAPGHPQNCILTEFAVDDLAAKLGIDPLVIRRKNLPPGDEAVAKANPLAWQAIRNRLYNEQLDTITGMCKWSEKWHPPGQGPKKGPVKHGMGMAMHTWGGFAAGGAPPPNECTVIISRDGSVTAETSTQDLGTGQRTVTAIITAEILGLEPTDVILNFGESNLGRSSGSGGSTTLPSQAPATLRAAVAARDDLFAKVAKKLEADPKNLEVQPGKVVDMANKKEWSWKEFCARLGMEEAKGRGEWSSTFNDPQKFPDVAGLSSGQVGGVQVAEVMVDSETGVVRITDIYAVQDCGLLINKLACESQVAGGVVMGLNYALFEERIMDRATGRQVNPDMEFYKLGGIKDMPRIHVHMMDMPERGVIGIGEPPTISTAAAVGNAVFNALGVRVPTLPLTPQRVLDAMPKGGA